MAFFKFPWPGQKEQGGKPRKAARPSQQVESIEVMRRRARHRLIGAALLVLVGVVGFPILFDTQPRPIPVDIPIEIPDRNKVAPLVVPAAEAPAVAAAPAKAPERVASPAPSAPEVTRKPASSPEPAASAAAVAVKPRPEPKPESKPESKPAPMAEARPSSSDEAARARALLEGRTPANAPVAAATLPDHGRFIVQIGAFAEAEKAREARQKLERAGIKTYAQVVETKEGKRIRVRVGPFEGKAEAEKAATRIKGLNLPVSILLL